MKVNLSLDTAVIITLITVFLFGIGQAYLGALLRPFLIDPAVLNFTVQDKIYWGFLKGFNLFIYSSLIFMIMFALRHIWISSEIGTFFDKKLLAYVQKKLMIKHMDTLHPHNNSQKEEFEKSFTSAILMLLAGIILLIGYIFALSSIEDKGKDKGNAILENPTTLPKIRINNKDMQNYLIQCGSLLCAVIDEKKNVSLVEPKNIVMLGSNFEKNKAP